MSLVVDGGNILVHKRNIQVAADAAALAVAQSVNLTTSPASCDSACSDQGKAYAKKNGVDVDSSWQACDAGHTTNCWTYPYVDKSGVTHYDQVEVRLTTHVTTFIAGMIGLFGADVSARAVASTNPVTGTTTSPDSTIHGTTFTIPGGTHTTTGPDVLSGDSGVAFTMSRLCTAISYSGAGSGTAVLGAFATNGGLDLSGNKPKKMTWLGFNQPGCPNNPPSPPSGTNQCTATAPSWGDATDSNNLCVKTLVTLHGPINWPIAPPTPPTLKAGNAWNPATDYPSKCLDPGTTSITGNGWASSHPPAIYCVSGAGTTLTFGGGANGADVSGGDGYTFFALNGAKIATAGNTTVAKSYWPSACGPRPSNRVSFTCFGRTIANYDPQTLFYSTFASADGSCAICLNGNGGDLTGDIFATKPDVFPPLPGPTQTGGLVSVAGGALSAGQGFIESWLLTIQGNTGSYKGTGASLVIPGTTTITTDPDTVTTSPDTVISGTVGTTTIGTNLDLNE
jgi:hypothetical protein